MTIEEYIEQLSSELKKLVGVQPVGKVWIDFHVPRGGIPFLAQEVSRSLYADLLKYAQDTGQMKTEAEWQEMYVAQNGYVPYYSDGDGVNTFRMPSMGSTYPQFASSLDDVRVFVEEGLPNITGTFDIVNHNPNSGHKFTGAFGKATVGSMPVAGMTDGVSWNEGWGTVTEYFNASGSNPIYGNSVHVTPKTGKILIGVYAIGVVTDVGSVDTFELYETVEKLNANLDGKVNKTGDTMTGTFRNTGGEVIVDYAPNEVSDFAQFRAANGNYAIMLRNDGSNSWILLTNAGDQYGKWNDLRPMRIDNVTGDVHIPNLYVGGGKIWIE